MTKKIVTIPHSGLRTVIESKTVFETKESPSHTVGLELVTNDAASPTTYTESPSHTVGLEREAFSMDEFKYMVVVTIPHSGLRTDSTLQTGQTYFGVTIPHSGLRTSNDHINQNKTYQSFCQGGTPFK